MPVMTDQEVTLTLTMNEKARRIQRYDPPEPRSKDIYPRNSSPNSGTSTLPLTVSEDGGSSFRGMSPSGSELRSTSTSRFRLPWNRDTRGSSISGSDAVDPQRRLEKEKEAEDFLKGISGRSLSIQRMMVEKVLSKEKRKVKFGMSSGKLMDLAIRRYSFKLSELERDIELERTFNKCPEEFGFVLRHMAEKLKLPADCQKFRKLYWDMHGRHLDLTRIMFDEIYDMARKRQLALEKISRKVIHPENSHYWWDEDETGQLVPSKEHVEWICWGYSPDAEEVSKICKRIAKMHPPDTETVRLYRAQAILST